MAESLQHRLDNYHPPRVHITYDVEIGNAKEQRELPFIVGILANLSQGGQKKGLKSRDFIDISSVNFTSVMESINPSLVMQVVNHISGDSKKLNLSISFKCMDDFSPLNIIQAIPVTAQLHGEKVLMKDFLTKIDANPDLQEIINEILKNNDSLKKLIKELSRPFVNSLDLQSKSGKLSLLDTVLYKGCMIHSDSQQSHAIAQLKALTDYIQDNKNSIIPTDVYALVQQRIANIDSLLQDQLNEIIHHPDFSFRRVLERR